MNKVIITTFILLITSSCSYLPSFFEDTDPIGAMLEDYKKHDERDYVDHLASLALDYVNSPGIKLLKINSKSRDYLKGVYQRIAANNELLLTDNLTPKFYIVRDQVPFCFSLPKGHFFFSLGLITKYFNHEDLLISALTYEIVKNQRKLYEKKIIVPVGYMRTGRILSLTRIPLEVKMEINKWTFYAMKRAGYDGLAYLIWLQAQNKNSMDFALQFGDSRSISQEEYLFKSFIVKQGIITDQDKRMSERNSSVGFYNFIRSVKRQAL